MPANTFLVVIDTNVWISGLLTRTGAPALLTRQVIRTGQPVLSPETHAELEERLWRPKFDRYVTLEQRRAFLKDLLGIALWVEVPPAVAARKFCRDPADDQMIHAALAAEAPWLVTGDRDILVLSASLAAQGVKILSPADALALPEFQRRY